MTLFFCNSLVSAKMRFYPRSDVIFPVYCLSGGSQISRGRWRCVPFRLCELVRTPEETDRPDWQKVAMSLDRELGVSMAMFVRSESRLLIRLRDEDLCAPAVIDCIRARGNSIEERRASKGHKCGRSITRRGYKSRIDIGTSQKD